MNWVSLFAILGLASPLVVFNLLDKHLKAELRHKLADTVFGTSQPVSERVTRFHKVLSSALGVGLLKRTLRLLMIGVISVLFIYSLQYFLKQDEFQSASIPFLKSIVHLNPFPILTMMSFVAVDAFSFYQTVTFSRLATYCKNPLEVVFIASSDILSSFFIVIIILPFLIIIAHRITSSDKEANIQIALDEITQVQSMSIRDAIKAGAPQLRGAEEDFDENQKNMEDVNTRGWYYNTPTVFVAPANEGLSPEEVVKRQLRSIGTTLFLEKGDFDPQQTANAIAKIIESNPYISSVKVNDSTRDVFGRSIYILSVSGKSGSRSSNILDDYMSLMYDINFFGYDMPKVFSLGSKKYSENDIVWLELINGLKFSENNKVVYICDDGGVTTTSKADFLSEKANECQNGVAMVPWGIQGIASVLSYNLKNETVIPILPTAVSSIFLTITIYFCIIAWLLLPYIRNLVEKFADNGSSLFINNQFKITFVVIFLIVYPFIFIFGG